MSLPTPLTFRDTKSPMQRAWHFPKRRTKERHCQRVDHQTEGLWSTWNCAHQIPGRIHFKAKSRKSCPLDNSLELNRGYEWQGNGEGRWRSSQMWDDLRHWNVCSKTKAKFLKRLSIMQAFAKIAETAVRKPVSTPKKILWQNYPTCWTVRSSSKSFLSLRFNPLTV